MNWRKREDHPELFENGETMLVAVAAIETQFGLAVTRPKFEKWEIDVVIIHCDEDFFSIRLTNGDPWGWDWEDAEYYVPIKEVQEGLPKP